MGIRYKSYCSNIVRTLLINPSKEQDEFYNFLLSLHDEVLAKLQHGVKLCDVYNDAVAFVEKSHKDLVPKMIKNLGFVLHYIFIYHYLYFVTFENRGCQHFVFTI